MMHVWTKPVPLRSLHRPLVAVVDEDEAFRRGALHLLRRLDATGIGLLGTSSALRWIANARAAVVVVDTSRLGIVAALARSMPADQRPALIATTAEPADAARALVEGARGVLARPLDAEQFVVTLGGVLGRAALLSAPPV